MPWDASVRILASMVESEGPASVDHVCLCVSAPMCCDAGWKMTRRQQKLHPFY